MKRKIACFIIFSFLMAFMGCASKKDTLKFIYEGTGLPDKECASYEVNIGSQVGGAVIVAELWKDGQCTKSTPLTVNKDTKKIDFSFLVEDENNGLNVQIETDQVSGSVLTCFELPEDVKGYSFTAYEDKEIINISAGEEVLLGAMAFDTGKGVRIIDCESLISQPERIKEYSCILVIRATFTAEQIDAQSEA